MNPFGDRFCDQVKENVNVTVSLIFGFHTRTAVEPLPYRSGCDDVTTTSEVTAFPVPVDTRVDSNLMMVSFQERL